MTTATETAVTTTADLAAVADELNKYLVHQADGWRATRDRIGSQVMRALIDQHHMPENDAERMVAGLRRDLLAAGQALTDAAYVLSTVKDTVDFLHEDAKATSIKIGD